MKIFDCFMYFDEEVILDIRLNTLNEFIDYFVIVESKFTHKGDGRVLKFNHKKFEKFKDKIIYLVYDQPPAQIKNIKEEDSEDNKSIKYILNANYRENGQRNYIVKGLDNAKKDDVILISDVDEIPNLSEVDFYKINEKIILFKQDMFYYKFNLYLPNLIWTGTKGCRKKDLVSPQWLRNIKDKKYSTFRLDILFSKVKYNSIKFINNGGWHFTNVKTAKEIEHKFKSYLHHREFDEEPLSVGQIDEIIKNKQAIYDLNVDKRINKIGNGSKLEKYDLNKLPLFIQKNLNNYKEWMD
jgi:beta-1,4-mannosyl-glycoprotein beta-1,4-N-acetylglucosaminyltransferase